MLDGRDFVTPDDVKALAQATLGHRVIVSPSARVREVDSYTVRFDWAYQVAPGNPDLKKQLPKDGKRNIDRTNPIALMK